LRRCGGTNTHHIHRYVRGCKYGSMRIAGMVEWLGRHCRGPVRGPDHTLIPAPGQWWRGPVQVAEADATHPHWLRIQPGITSGLNGPVCRNAVHTTRAAPRGSSYPSPTSVMHGCMADMMANTAGHRRWHVWRYTSVPTGCAPLGYIRRGGRPVDGSAADRLPGRMVDWAWLDHPTTPATD